MSAYRVQVVLFRASALTAEDRRDAATRARWTEGVASASCARLGPQTAALTMRVEAADVDAALDVARAAGRSIGLAFDSPAVIGGR